MYLLLRSDVNSGSYDAVWPVEGKEILDIFDEGMFYG
jgi:hypothetical protein